MRKYSKVGELPTVEKDGYIFDGWYTDEYGGEKITTDYEITKDEILE